MCVCVGGVGNVATYSILWNRLQKNPEYSLVQTSKILNYVLRASSFNSERHGDLYKIQKTMYFLLTPNIKSPYKFT